MAGVTEAMLHSNLNGAQPRVQTVYGCLLLALTALAGVLGSLIIAPGAEGLAGAYLAALMVATAATDARTYLIPNELNAAAFPLAVLRAGTIYPMPACQRCCGQLSAPR